MRLDNQIALSKNYYQVIKKEIYEDIIFSIMSDSKILFMGNYKKIDSQSNGECDYIELDNNGNIIKKFDAKILFLNKACQYIAKNNISSFLEELKNSINETYDCILNNKDLEKTALYQELLYDLDSRLKDDENGILFFPFHFSLKHKDSLVYNLGQDNIESLFNCIKNNKPNLFSNRDLFFITLNDFNQTVIYWLTSSYGINKYEFIDKNYLDDYIDLVNIKVSI